MAARQTETDGKRKLSILLLKELNLTYTCCYESKCACLKTENNRRCYILQTEEKDRYISQSSINCRAQELTRIYLQQKLPFLLLLLLFFFILWETKLKTCKKDLHVLAKTPNFAATKYSRTSMAWTSLGLWKYVQDRGSSSQWVLIIAPGQEA